MSIFDLAYGRNLRYGGGTSLTPSASSLTPPTTSTPRARSKILELLEALANEQGAPIPATYRDLPEEERRRIRGQGLLSVGAAVADHEPGKLGSALLQAAMANAGMQQQGVEEYADRLRRQRAERRSGIGDQLELEQARQAEEERIAKAEAREHERERLSSLAEAIRQQLDPDDPRGVEADALAASGDQAGMARLLGGIREEQQRRALAEKLGVDPNDPEALETAQRIRQEEELRKRGLGPYFRQPERPREGSLQVGADGYYHLIDQITGRATRTDVLAPAREGGAASTDEKERAEDLETATQHAQWKRAQLYDTYQAQLADESRWPRDPNGRPIQPQPPKLDFEGDVKARFDQLQRVRRATKPARLVSPVGGANPQGAPTSATGAGRGKPQEPTATVEDVVRLLPKGFMLDPGAKAQIEQDLRGGPGKKPKTPAQIRNEILRANGML